MIQLSKYTQPLLECTPFDCNTCKLVGEFAGNDVHLLRGGQYYVLHSGKNTFVRMKIDGMRYGSRLGENRHIHVYEVVRRTPCSYVTKYVHTIIICHSLNRKDVFKFRKIFCHLNGKTRRFFPNRTLDVQKYLIEYLNMRFEIIPDEVEITYKHGNFTLNLDAGMQKYFKI